GLSRRPSARRLKFDIVEKALVKDRCQLHSLYSRAEGPSTHLALTAGFRYISPAFCLPRKESTHDLSSPVSVSGPGPDPRNHAPTACMGFRPGDAHRTDSQGESDRRGPDDPLLRPADQRRVGDGGHFALHLVRDVARSDLSSRGPFPADP